MMINLVKADVAKRIQDKMKSVKTKVETEMADKVERQAPVITIQTDRLDKAYKLNTERKNGPNLNTDRIFARLLFELLDSFES